MTVEPLIEPDLQIKAVMQRELEALRQAHQLMTQELNRLRQDNRELVDNLCQAVGVIKQLKDRHDKDQELILKLIPNGIRLNS